MARMRGQGGALVKHEKGSIIPSRQEIVKDLIKYFFTEYGLDLAESLFEPISTEKLLELAKRDPALLKRFGIKPPQTGGGGLVILFALLAFGGKRRRKR